MMASSEERKKTKSLSSKSLSSKSLSSKSLSSKKEGKEKKKKSKLKKEDSKKKKKSKKTKSSSKSSKKKHDKKHASCSALHTSNSSLQLGDDDDDQHDSAKSFAFGTSNHSGKNHSSNDLNNNSAGSFGDMSASDFAFGELPSGGKDAGDSAGSLGYNRDAMAPPKSLSIALPDIDENPYKTQYVTINPNDRSYKAARAARDGVGGDGGVGALPELGADDASWLFDPGSAAASAGLADNLSKLQGRLKEKLQLDGYIDDSDHEEQEKKKKHKHKKKRSKTKLSPKLFELLNRDPARKKERKRYAKEDQEAAGYFADCPELAKEMYEFTNFYRDEFEDDDDDENQSSNDNKNTANGDEAAAADSNSSSPTATIKMYPLTMLCALGASKNTVQLCFEAYPDALWHDAGAYGTPLHFCSAFHGRPDVIQFLGKQQNGRAAKALNQTDQRTPLHVAAYNSAPLETISSLIGVHPEALSIGDQDGYTPLHIACAEEAELDVLEEMMDEDKALVVAKSKTGATPLHLAVFHEASFETIDSMVATNAACLQVPDGKGRLPLHMAASCTETGKDVIRLFLHKYPAAVETRTNHGKTPYGVAKKAKRGKDILSLLKTTADS